MDISRKRSLLVLRIALPVVILGWIFLAVPTRAHAGEVCNGSITPRMHTSLRAATRGRDNQRVSLLCHDFKVPVMELRYDPARNLYVTVGARFVHVIRFDVDELYSFWVEIDRRGEIVSFRDDVVTLRLLPHPGEGDWESAAKRLAQHVADFLAREVRQAAAQCERREETIVVGEGSLGVRTVRDHRDECRLDVPVLPADHRTE
jgi:hypothetical protein